MRVLACHAGDPGSIPGVCLYFILFLSLTIDLVSKKVEFKTFLNPFSLNVQRLYCFYYIHIRSQNPIEKSFVMLFEVTNLKWIRLGGALPTELHFQTIQNKTDKSKQCGQGMAWVRIPQAPITMAMAYHFLLLFQTETRRIKFARVSLEKYSF